MTISLVSGLINPSSSSGVASFSITVINVGDVFPFMVHVFGVTTPAVQSITSSNMLWFFASRIADATYGSTLELWYGVSTATGAQTQTITWNPANGSNPTELAGAEYISSVGTKWSLVNADAQVYTTNTTMTSPSILPTGAEQLAFTAWDPMQTAGPGSTSGYTYTDTTFNEYLAWNANPAAGLPNPVQPMALQSPTGTYQAASMILQASTASQVDPGFSFPMPSVQASNR